MFHSPFIDNVYKIHNVLQVIFTFESSFFKYENLSDLSRDNSGNCGELKTASVLKISEMRKCNKNGKFGGLQ